MFQFDHLNTYVITILILIIQKVVVPRFKAHFYVYILPSVMFILGMYYSITSDKEISTKLLLMGISLVLSVVILLIGESSWSSYRKEIQEKYGKDEFYKKR